MVQCAKIQDLLSQDTPQFMCLWVLPTAPSLFRLLSGSDLSAILGTPRDKSYCHSVLHLSNSPLLLLSQSLGGGEEGMEGGKQFDLNSV